MSYQSETAFQITDDKRMVYSLPQSVWKKGRPIMVNDIAVTIEARHLPAEAQAAIARTIQLTLNANYSRLG